MADNVVQFQIKGLTQNQVWYLNLVYGPADQTPAGLVVGEAVDAWVDVVLPTLLDTMCDSSKILSVKGTLRGTPNAGLAKQVNVNASGTIADQELPVWVVASYKKYPDNSTIIPIGRPNFENGRMAISGVPESSQEDGYIAAAYALLAQDFEDAVVPLAQVINPSLQLMMARNFGNALEYAGCLVPLVNLARVGSQLTRKE